jgi:hypothetical protein
MTLNRARAAALMLSLSFVAGCSPAVAPTPTPSPTYQCVPEAGGDPLPCGPIEFEASQRRDALYAEAEAVYRRFWAEIVRIDSNPEPTMTPELEATTVGPFRDALIEVLGELKGAQRVSGESPIVWVKRLVGLQRSGSIVALETCTDERNARFANPDGGELLVGQATRRRVYFVQGADGALRLIDTEYMGVEQC